MPPWTAAPKPTEPNAAHYDADEVVQSQQRALTQSRRRLLGAALLLLLACGLIPWMLDNKSRAWGEDVILKMPKSDAPYRANPKSPNPVASPASNVPTSNIPTGNPTEAPAGNKPTAGAPAVQTFPSPSTPSNPSTKPKATP